MTTHNPIKRIAVLLALISAFQIKAQFPSNCRIAAYNFNQQNVNDNIGTCHGTAVGATPATDRFGNSNGAWYLHGHPQSYLNLGTYSTLKPSSGSISMWFNLDTAVTIGSGFLYNPLLHTKCQQGNNCYEAYAIYYNYINQKVFAFTTQLYCNQPVAYGPAVSAHIWHNVVYTYDHTMIKIYYDGVLQDSTVTGFSPVFLASDSVMVGTSANVQNDRQFNGSVDDIEFYGCVLTPKEVTDIYHYQPPVVTGLHNTWAPVQQVYIYGGNNRLSIYSPSGKPYELVVSDLLGKTILKNSYSDSQVSIHLPEDLRGVYIVKVSSGQDNTCKKIVIE